MKSQITKLLTAVVLIGAPSMALAAPRTLPSGAPACGNAMGKVGYTDGCTSAERAAWQADRERERVETERHELAQQRAAEARRVAATANQTRSALKVAFFDGSGLCLSTNAWTPGGSGSRWRRMARPRW